MLIAMNEKGELIRAAAQEEAERIKELKNGVYLCPACQNPVIFKAGTIKVPHFAHKQSKICQSFSEGESAKHLKGKSDFYGWLSLYKEVQLEAFLPEISQRPDLLIDMRIAVEFQCSSIASDLFIQRTNGYVANGYIPLWIYGGPPIKKRGELYTFTPFHRLFFQYSSSFGYWFLAYSPDTEKFSFYSKLIPIQSSLYHASVQEIPLHKMTYPPAFSPSFASSFSLSSWFQQKHRWLQRQLYFRKGISDPFFRFVYEAGHHPLLLPVWIGLPVRSMALMKSHPIEWQFYLWHDCLSRTRKTTVKQAAKALTRRILKGDLQINVFPLISSLTVEGMIEEYIELLKEAGIAEQPLLSRTTFEQTEKEKAFAAEFGELVKRRLMF